MYLNRLYIQRKTVSHRSPTHSFQKMPAESRKTSSSMHKIPVNKVDVWNKNWSKVRREKIAKSKARV